jgi:uncharacterized protein DUF6949
MHYVAIHLYAIALGFAAAGVVASFVQLVSGQPLRLSFDPSSILASLGGVMLRLVCGPALLMRNTWVDAKQRTRQPVWLGLSLVIAGLWSLFSGALLIGIMRGL